jgi:hypothetical protein
MRCGAGWRLAQITDDHRGGPHSDPHRGRFSSFLMTAASVVAFRGLERAHSIQRFTGLGLSRNPSANA